MSKPMHPVVKTLKKARRLISKPDKWCKKTAAKNKAGNCVSELSDSAYSFCILGAFSRTSPDGSSYHGAINNFIAANIKALTYPNKIGVEDFNDRPDRTHDEVLKAMDRAVKLAEKNYDPSLRKSKC
jgi:hypothetical protein